MVILTVFFVIRKSNKFDRFFPILENEFFFSINSTKLYDYVKVIKTFYSSPSTHTIGVRIIGFRSSILLT